MPKRAQKKQLDLPKNLRANMEYYRQLKDYNKEELADIMGFGLTTYYARLKDLDYTLPQLAKAANLFGVPLRTLLYGTLQLPSITED